MPPYLCWSYPLKALPPTFHKMDLASFKLLIKYLTTSAMITGIITHPTLLALGLIKREFVDCNVFSPDPQKRPAFLNTAQYDIYEAALGPLRKRVLDTAAETALTFPDDCTQDRTGYICAKELPGIEPEEGSPLQASSASRTAAIKYLNSLSTLDAYHHAIGIMHKVIPPSLHFF